jgi:hypothetical protein
MDMALIPIKRMRLTYATLVCDLSPDNELSLTVIAAWFIEHPLCAKKMYITMVMARLPRYMLRVEPIRIPRHSPESVSSIFSMQNSAKV